MNPLYRTIQYILGTALVLTLTSGLAENEPAEIILQEPCTDGGCNDNRRVVPFTVFCLASCPLSFTFSSPPPIEARGYAPSGFQARCFCQYPANWGRDYPPLPSIRLGRQSGGISGVGRVRMRTRRFQTTVHSMSQVRCYDFHSGVRLQERSIACTDRNQKAVCSCTVTGRAFCGCVD